MANPEHLAILKQGVEVWNKWREATFERPDLSEIVLLGIPLSGANLKGVNFMKADLSSVDFRGADLRGANFQDADLSEADLRKVQLTNADIRSANLTNTDLRGADLSYSNFNSANCYEADLENSVLTGAHLSYTKLVSANLNFANISSADLSNAYLICASLEGANLQKAVLTEANLSEAGLWNADLKLSQLDNTNLIRANLQNADLRMALMNNSFLSSANLTGANLQGASLRSADLNDANLDSSNLVEADLSGANLRGTFLCGSNLTSANFAGANFSEANLENAILDNADMTKTILIETNLNNATIQGAKVYGISAWNIEKKGLIQKDLVITRDDEPIITVDDLEMAQFIYLMLNNQKIRDVIDTLTSKAVLILGRFSEERKPLLDAIKEELRLRNYLPILFDFEKPAGRNLTETISILAKMSRFVIADLTDAKSIPQELSHIVPFTPSLPVLPIILEGQKEYAMFEHFKAYPCALACLRQSGGYVGGNNRENHCTRRAKGSSLEGRPQPHHLIKMPQKYGQWYKTAVLLCRNETNQIK